MQEMHNIVLGFTVTFRANNQETEEEPTDIENNTMSKVLSVRNTIRNLDWG
jgi:hypothetical protein